jgi:hypothetical protein
MKIIVINDSDGHTWGIPHTPENIKKVHDAAAEHGILFEAEDELPAGRTFGSICEVIDTSNLREFPTYNPFE